MATLSSRGNSLVTTTGTTWAATANAYDGTVGTNNATYATWTSTTRSGTGTIVIGGYTFAGIGGTINSVSANIRHLENSTTNITALTVQLQDSSGTAIGSAATATRATTVATNTLTLGTPTVAQAQGGLRVLVTITRGNTTTSTTFSLDYVDLTVDYTPPPTPTGSVVAQGMYASDKKTPIALGAATGTDGYTTTTYLNILVSNTNNQTASENFPSVEVKPVGTAFTGTGNYTANSFLAQESAEPSAMRGSVMAYDAVNQRYIMTGGYDGSARYNDVWELDASGLAGKWRKLSPSGTPPVGKNLGTASMINQNGKAWFVYYGGNAGSDANDMTILDCTVRGSETWTTVTQTSNITARSYTTLHSTVVPTSSTTSDFYFFGGWASSRENELIKTTISTAGAVPTAQTWTTVTANGAAGSPPARSGTMLFYDDTNNRLIVHGGYGSAGLADTWAYNLPSGGWTQLSTTGDTIVGRELFAGAYDPVSKRLVVAMGWSTEAVTNNRNDIYQIDFSTNTNGVITLLKAHDYPNCDMDPASSIASCYDPKRRLMVTSGLNGYDGTDRYSYAFDFTETVVPGQMSLYGMNIVDWQRARDAPAHCTDTDAGEFLMINGFSGMADDTLNASALNGDHMNEIWAYNPSSNTTRYANQGIFGMVYKEGVFAAYDPIGKRVIAFGGLTGLSLVSGSAWELKRDSYGNYKARKMYPTGTPPSNRWLMAGAFDAVNNRLVIWGGGGDSALSDTAIYTLDFSGGGDGVWSSVSPSGNPPAVWQPMYAHDKVNNKLYICSGATNFAASSFSTRLDYINLNTLTWTNVNTTGVTGVRGGAMVYEAGNNALAAFGGYNGSVVNNNNYELTLSTTSAWSSPTESTALPPARRSSAAWRDNVNDGMLVSSGRPVSGQWFRDYTLYTPAYSYGIAGWFDRAPAVFLQDTIQVTGLANNTSYHWQAIDIAGISPTATFTASFGANAETAIDFTVGAAKPSYTKTHGTSSVKKKQPTKSHSTDTTIRGTSYYTRESNASLPTTNAPRSTAYLAGEYSTVATDDSTYIDQTGTGFNIHQFEKTNTNNTSNITVTWNGKTTSATSTSAAYLQIWNNSTSAWETIATDATTAAGTDFTLTATVSTNLTNYYDANFRVQFRVYQAV